MQNLANGLWGYSWPQIGMVAIPALGWIASWLSQSMPEPDKTDSKFYITFYNLVHLAGANRTQLANGVAAMRAKNVGS